MADTYDLKLLKQLLIHKYSRSAGKQITPVEALVMGWEQGLDIDGNGRLNFSEFSKAVREMGYKGDIRACFNAMDANGNGLVTIDEFDDEAGKEYERQLQVRKTESEKRDAENLRRIEKHHRDVGGGPDAQLGFVDSMV